MLAVFLTNAAYLLYNGMILRAKDALAILTHGASLEKLQEGRPLLDAHSNSADMDSFQRVLAQGHGLLLPYIGLRKMSITP